MPQKRMAARGQPAKLAKGPSLKKAPAKAFAEKSKVLAKKANISSNTLSVRTSATKVKMDGKAALKGAAQDLAKSADKNMVKNAGKSTAKVPAAQAVLEKTIAVKPAKDGRPQVIEKAKAALKTAIPTVETKPEQAKATAKEPKPVKEGKRGRKISIDVNPNEAASALSGKWSSLFKKAEQIEAKPYNMKAVFEEKTAITHKVLGWGYILANRNDRLEVLFKDGIKYLISNYKT